MYSGVQLERCFTTGAGREKSPRLVLPHTWAPGNSLGIRGFKLRRIKGRFYHKGKKGGLKGVKEAI